MYRLGGKIFNNILVTWNFGDNDLDRDYTYIASTTFMNKCIVFGQ